MDVGSSTGKGREGKTHRVAGARVRRSSSLPGVAPDPSVGLPTMVGMAGQLLSGHRDWRRVVWGRVPLGTTKWRSDRGQLPRAHAQCRGKGSRLPFRGCALAYSPVGMSRLGQCGSRAASKVWPVFGGSCYGCGMRVPLCLAGLLVTLPMTVAHWPSWRGPSQNNTTPDAGYPLEWDASKNKKWRTELPDAGNSSPIVWGDRIFITQALEDGKRRTLLCFDRGTGNLLWQKGVDDAPIESHHETNPHCAASPVTDGERVVASFGTAGIQAFDLAGKLLWKADLGPQRHTWGQGSSPVIHDDHVIVYHGPGRDSKLAVLNKRDGRIRWQVPLAEEQPAERFDGFAGKSDGALGSFATPLIVQAAGRSEIVLPVAGKVRAYAPADGKALWTCDTMNPLVYASASYGEGIVVAMGGYFGATVFVKPGGEGDVTASRRTYYEQRAKKHRIGSPIIKDGHVYISNTIGVAECIELATGRIVWEERLKANGPKGETWASMVLSGDRLYVVNQSGDTVVLRAAPKYEVLAVNSVGELSNSTLAFSTGEIFLRTHKALWCFRDSAR